MRIVLKIDRLALLLSLGLFVWVCSSPEAHGKAPAAKTGANAAANAGAQRVLHFPEEESVGDLCVVADPEEVRPRGRQRKYWVGEARGAVRLEKQLPLSLLVNLEGSQRPDFLSRLGPDDLYSLDMSDGKITDRQLQQISRLTGLKLLNITAAEVTDDGLKYIKPLKSLKYLFLNNASINGSGLKYLSDMKSLERLDLRGTEIDDRGIMALPVLPALEALVLRGTKISSEGLKCLRMTPKLQSLDFTNTNVTAAGLRYTRFTPELTHLSIQDSAMRDDGSSYMSKLKLLQVVDVSGCHITDKFFSIAMAGLTHLDCGQNRLITNAGVAKLVRGSPHLNNLRLRATGITDDAMRSLGTLRQLSLLDLDNTNITDAGLNHLGTPRNLTELILTGTKVTRVGISKLAKALPECHINHSLE